MEGCTNDKDTTTANSFHPKLVPLLVSMFFMLFNIIMVSSFSYSGIITSLAKLRPVRTANEKSRKHFWLFRETYCLHYVQICIISVCVKYWKSWKLNFATNWTQPSLQNYTECSKRSSGRQSDLCRQLCNWCYWSERIELNSIKADQFKVFPKPSVAISSCYAQPRHVALFWLSRETFESFHISKPLSMSLKSPLYFTT